MEEKETKGIPVKVFQFNEAYQAPIYRFEKKGDYHFISFGADNLYPIFLLDLYNNYGSPLNRAIINKKTKMTAGFGYKPLVDEGLKQWAKKNNLERLLLYLAKDFMIYGGFAVEVIWNREGTSFDIKYLPIHTLRIGLKENEDEKDYYWYSADWGNFKKEEYEPKYIKRFDPTDRQGRQALYYIEPNPAHTALYPIPDYSTAINYIDLDYQIGKFHINQVRQGFSPSFILNFATGIPTIDEQNQFFREFQRNYKGTDGAGKIIITYSDGGDQKPELTPINLNDSDERFIMLQEMVEKNITQAHEMPVQLVSFQPGKLGSQDERKELMAEFQTYYIAIKQNQLEEAINGILETIGYTEQIVLNDYVTADSTGLLSGNQEPLQIADSRVDKGSDNDSEIFENFAEIGERGGIRESKKAPKSDTPNPNPKGEGTAKGDASTQRGAEVSQAVEESLKKKVDEFNERYKDKLGYGVNIGMLKSVYQRGIGAYNVSHSPAVKSPGQWAQARVNAFLYLVRTGRPENNKYVGDNDLLPKGHPKTEK